MVDDCYNQMPDYTVDKFRSGQLTVPLYSEEAASQPQYALVGSAVGNSGEKEGERVRMVPPPETEFSSDRVSLSSKLSAVVTNSPGKQRNSVKSNKSQPTAPDWAKRRKSSPTMLGVTNWKLEVDHKLSASPVRQTASESEAMLVSQWVPIDGGTAVIRHGDYVNGPPRGSAFHC
jgi:hypothetical protein